MTDQDEAFCRCCGQKCHPQAYQRPAEDFDEGTGEVGWVDDWCSPCCHDSLSRLPVTDQCEYCRVLAARGSEFPKYGNQVLCPGCMANHPDIEYELARASTQYAFPED